MEENEVSLKEEEAEMLLKSYQEGYEKGKADGRTGAWAESVRNIKNSLTIADTIRALNLVGVPKSERPEVIALL